MQKLCPALYGELLQWYHIPQSCTRYVIKASLSLLQRFFAIAAQVNSTFTWVHSLRSGHPFQWVNELYVWRLSTVWSETPLYSANSCLYFTDFIAQGGDPTGTGEGMKHPDSSKSCTWTFLVSFPDPLCPPLLKRAHEDETMNFPCTLGLGSNKCMRWE